ncbi:MAG TPA: hypothetical protein VGX25_23290 [Actinophytocola sp.]|uniref:hypothetical protein n=1 Tax=Actinophytocola sp. TaxID=1872138 RepID=UPI002DDD430B|nr:hypothetical protein [Actinophytocola sp.]HEV2782327.1 hypothetical protein [Actinophytocola sp.]
MDTLLTRPVMSSTGAVHTGPVFHYQTSVDGCAVLGGHVHRGQRFTELADGTHADARVGEVPTQPTSFGVDTAGELYLVNDLPGQLHLVGFERVPPVT